MDGDGRLCRVNAAQNVLKFGPPTRRSRKLVGNLRKGESFA
jgi:hypothetical protein